MFKKMVLIITALVLSAPFANACQISSLQINADVVGSETVQNVCTVSVLITQIIPGMCQLRGLKVGQEISVRVPHESSLPDGCPQDEGFELQGTIMRADGAFVLLNGTVK